ncbi:MAG TPA: M48 family metallopeptidase [Candidatus Binatia bacterium]
MRKHIVRTFSAGVLALVLITPPAYSFRKDRSFRESYDQSAEQQIDRVRRVMLPLLRATNHRLPLDDIRVSIVDNREINAASAGNGQYLVTRGLLSQANDEELRGVLAHEIAHEDLGHPARAQLVGTGVGIGLALLEQFFPASSALAPLAGSLITNNYTRPMELEADRHAVTLLERAGYSKQTMIDTLSWLAQLNGDTGGGFLSSHPATSERIQALRAIR